MAWVPTITLDADKTNVGSVSAIFTDTDETTFTYGRRAKVSAADADAFVGEAIAGRNAWQEQKTRTAALVFNVTARFEELDV